jgi:hypothetical protein
MTNANNNFLEEYSRFLDSTDRHLTYAALSIYRNSPEELSKKEERFFKRHLDSCAACSARLEEVAEVEGSELPIQSGFGAWTALPAFRYSIAALFVLAFGTAIAFYLQSRSRVEQPSPADQSLAVQISDPQKFVSNDMLENFITRSVRSASPAWFISPNNGDTLTHPFTFQWDGRKGARSYSMVVVDNRNVEVWKETTSAKSITIEKRLDPGLYYAKLQVDDVLAQVRKFVVLKGSG